MRTTLSNCFKSLVRFNNKCIENKTIWNYICLSSGLISIISGGFLIATNIPWFYIPFSVQLIPISQLILFCLTT